VPMGDLGGRGLGLPDGEVGVVRAGVVIRGARREGRV